MKLPLSKHRETLDATLNSCIVRMWDSGHFLRECQQLPSCDLRYDLWIVWRLQMARAIVMHQGNLFWFLALIGESFMASLTGVSPEQDMNSGTLDFVSHVANGRSGRFTWQSGSGTPGWESLLWHNCPYPRGSGWVSCHSNRHKNYPPDFSFWLFRVQHREVWDLSPICSQQR